MEIGFQHAFSLYTNFPHAIGVLMNKFYLVVRQYPAYGRAVVLFCQKVDKRQTHFYDPISLGQFKTKLLEKFSGDFVGKSYGGGDCQTHIMQSIRAK